MMLVFMLTVYLNGDVQPNPSYWKDINRCQYFAQKVRRQNYWWSYKYPQPEIGATCVPTFVDARRVRVWK